MPAIVVPSPWSLASTHAAGAPWNGIAYAFSGVFGATATENVSGNDGLDTLRIETAGQNIDTSNATTLSHMANIETIDMGNTAAGSGNSQLTLTPDSVLQLTHNESSTITSFSGACLLAHGSQ